MQTSGIRRIFIIAGIISLVVSYFGIWIRMIRNPVERTGSDFIAFYSAGRVAQNAGAAHVYDPNLQQNIQEEEVGFPLVPGQVLLYNHLPFLIPILQTSVSPNYVNSFYLWIFLLIALYIIGIFFLSRKVNLSMKGLRFLDVLIWREYLIPKNEAVGQLWNKKNKQK